MTAAARRRTHLQPPAAVPAIGRLAVCLSVCLCLALLAWTATARAEEGVASGDATVVEPPATSDPGPAPETPAPTPDSGPAQPDTTPAADPPPSEPAPQAVETPAEQDAASPPPLSGDSWEERSTGATGDGSGSHGSGGRDGSPSPGSGPTTGTLGAATQFPSVLTPEGDLSLLPVTQFTVAPHTVPNTGGSGAGYLSGGVGSGCLAVCPGGTRLASLSGASHSAVREATARANGTAAKASVLSLAGLPGAGGAGLFNLLIGGGGSGAAVVFVGFLAVLMAALALPREWATGFRVPSAIWRPSAYVTPIELPG